MNSLLSYQQVPQHAMKAMIRLLAVMLLCGLVVSQSVSGQQGTDVTLTNAAIIKLVRAGFKEKTVIAIINSRPSHFNLDTEQLVQLKHGGVSENIILAMLSQDRFIAGDELSDDAFFKGNDKKSNDDPTDDSQKWGTGIFGSSEGSKSQSRSRGGRGSNQNEGATTGTATVRILRPPTEAGGGAAPKLERTPTLDNEAIVRLVDAGFSEGTIIKRIEDSPSEFDLSPAKLDDLHKRRVTDPIIAAMSAAMGGKENENKPNAPLQDRMK